MVQIATVFFNFSYQKSLDIYIYHALNIELSIYGAFSFFAAKLSIYDKVRFIGQLVV